MKKLVLMSVLVGFIAAPALADFTFTQAQVLSFGKIDDYTKDTYYDPATFSGAYTTSASYGETLPPGNVGLVAHAVGRNVSLSGGTIDYIGLGITGVDLSAGGTFVVTLSNDDNEDWKYKLFADDGATAGGFVSGSWTTIAKDGASDTLSLACSGLDTISRIGIMVGSDEHDNTIHTSVVPEPATVLLLGLGGLALLRKRRG